MLSGAWLLLSRLVYCVGLDSLVKLKAWFLAERGMVLLLWLVWRFCLDVVFEF